MQKISLSNEQRVNLEHLHANTSDSRSCDRIKAVLLRSEIWPTPMIVQALRLHETTITRHINDYIEKEKLKPENGGSKSYLSTILTEEVVRHIMSETYQCSYQIIDYIFNKHKSRFSISGLNKWLHHQGFSYKKPKGVPHKFDPIKQADFIKENKALKVQTTDEAILFIDAMHPTQATKMSGGWIKKGHDKAIKTTGSRTRINIVGAIELKDLSATIVNRYDKVNSETIRQQYPVKNKTHLILDGAGYHRSTDLKDKAVKLNIKLHHLPPYSPNLNPAP